MASLRVCTITFDWYPFEVRALRMAEAAADAGYDVDVICLGKRGERRHEVIHGVHVYRLPVKRIAHTLPLKILYWCWFALLAEVVVTWFHLKRSYNVVHVHNMPDFLCLPLYFPGSGCKDRAGYSGCQSRIDGGESERSQAIDYYASGYVAGAYFYIVRAPCGNNR